MKFLAKILGLSVFLFGLFAMAEFESYSCRDASLDRYLWLRGISFSPEVDTQQKSELARREFLSRANQVDPLRGPWEISLIPVAEAQTRAFSAWGETLMVPTIRNLDDLRAFISTSEPKGESDFINAIRRSFLEDPKKTELEKQEILKFRSPQDIRSQSRNVGFIEATKDRAKALYGCSQINLMSSVGCSSAVDKMIDEISWSGPNLLFPGVWHELLVDESFALGVRQLSLTIFDRISLQQDGGNFFEEARMTYLKLGLNRPQAEKYTWMLMALYGNGGQNVGARLLTFDLEPKELQLVAALGVIGVGVAVLDFKNAENGKSLYSMPQEISDGCLTTKPYHFWLAAYIAHRVVELGYSQKVAEAATALFGRVYQVKRNSSNAADSIERLFIKSNSHPTMAQVKLDIVLNGMGAYWGSGRFADASTANTKTITNVYREYLRQIQPHAGLPLEESRRVAKDEKSAFDFFNTFFQPQRFDDLLH